MLINDNDYSCHVTVVELFKPIVWGPYHVTSYLDAGHTHIHTHKHTHTHADVCTETILRKQVHADMWPARAWFNNLVKLYILSNGKV